ncbi:uncharacterized protein [Halyomorpha halys]|uniref:uncharacterized protein n=1 Tax=Halyomorpha halys TaxID=286706 RepID=UPI0006D4E9D9|nr:uncharacterized protein LOC106689603 [Halyomorpha halys]
MEEWQCNARGNDLDKQENQPGKDQMFDDRKETPKNNERDQSEWKRLEQVQNFKYLGAHLNENGYIDEEVSQRIFAAGRIFSLLRRGFLGKREVTRKTKIMIYKLTFLHILSYSSESWTLTSKHKSRIESMEMRYLRKVELRTRRDRVRNSTVRTNHGVKWLIRTPSDGPGKNCQKDI